jgi:hypothetical protein
MTTHYLFGEYVLASNITLPELAPSAAPAADYTFHYLRRGAYTPPEPPWYHHWQSPEGVIWLSFGRHDGGYLLRFPELADFLISADGAALRCYPLADLPSATIRHLLLDQVFPLVLSKRGVLALHASAVVAPQGVAAFVGVAGRGKSTLAASLAQQGFPAIADDCLLLELEGQQLFARPSYAGLRLWSDSVATLFERRPALRDVAHYTSKKRLLGGDGPIPFWSDAAPVRRIYFLPREEAGAEVSEIAIAPLSAREAFIELFSYAYKLDIADRNMLAREFDQLRRVAALPLFFRLAFPHDFAALPQVRAAVVEHLG